MSCAVGTVVRRTTLIRLYDTPQTLVEKDFTVKVKFGLGPFSHEANGSVCLTKHVREMLIFGTVS